MVAKDEASHAILSKQFAPPKATIKREYLALVWGTPCPAAGRIDGSHGTLSVSRGAERFSSALQSGPNRAAISASHLAISRGVRVSPKPDLLRPMGVMR